MSKSKHRGLKLRTKTVLITGLVLLFALGSVTFTMMRTSTASLQEALLSKALLLGQETGREIKRVLGLGIPLETLNMSEHCADLVASHDNLSFAFLVDAKGTILYHSDADQEGEPVPAGFLDTARPPPAAVQRSVLYGGEEIYGTVVPVTDGSGTYLAAFILGLDGRFVSEKVTRQAWNSLLIGTGFFAAALLMITIFFSRQVGRPLADLVATSRAAAEGDLSQTISVRRRDEIGELSQAFGDMLRQIHTRDQELHRHREELEKIVAERTSELGETNRNLERELAERKRVEELRRSSEERYRSLSQQFNALLDAIPDRITLLSADLEVLWANRGALGGVSDGGKDVTGRRCHELWHRQETPCHPCPVQRTFASGRAESDAMPSASGEFWDVRTIPLKDDCGDVTNVIEVARNVTEQRKLEEQLRHSQKIEAVGQLAGGVAHDFNNILNIIMGFTALIEMSAEGNKDIQNNVEQIMGSIERATELVRGLLAFSRKQVIELRTVDISSIIRNLEMILTSLTTEDISLSIDLTDSDLTVLGDSNQIDQVLINLATNARDAMPEGGTLSLSTMRVEVTPEFVKTQGYGTAGSYALIAVSDTGTGMNEKLQRRIFEPFFTTKDLGKGTGLGLAIVYGIVKQHSGFINCHSWIGKGTTFEVYLPLTKSAPEEVGSAMQMPPVTQHGSETILIAEDEPQLRELMTNILTQYGYTVLTAADGEEAIRVYRESGRQIGLLLLDVIMPGKNGRETHDAIRKINPDVKALFISGYAADIIHSKGGLGKGIHYLSKPVAPHVLLQKVRELLDVPSRFP
jgi:signal transduction histidine kinase/HAMP domain-containing protein